MSRRRSARVWHGAVVTAAAGIGVLGVAAARDDVTIAPPQMADQLYSLLDARSPGERNGPVLSKKPKPAATPASRVKSLAKRSKPGEVAAQAPQAPVPPADALAQQPPVMVPADALFQEAVSNLDALPASAQQAALLPPGGGSGSGGGGIVFGSPGGGGGSAGNSPPPETGSVNPPPPPPVSAVPEPETWLMMLLGFGFIGYSLRRRQGSVEGGQVRHAIGPQL